MRGLEEERERGGKGRGKAVGVILDKFKIPKMGGKEEDKCNSAVISYP